MLILRVGLYVAVVAAVYVAWASSGAGYAIEVAMLRGLLSFMAVAFVAYLAELVVLTAPPARRGSGGAGDLEDGLDAEGLDGGANDDEDEPTNLPAVRAERDVAADKRRAA